MSATPDPGSLARELKRRAGEEGFDVVGVAAAGPIDRDSAALETWLQRGMHAGMRWMAVDPPKRADPRELLPGCRSVVVFGMNYAPEEARAAATKPERIGRVARYARGRDYHKVLGRKLARLADWLAETSGAAARRFVDTGPVLERAWAERAGVGWIGKNANLLTRDRGSWLLLGEILTTAELEPDRGPHTDHCGSCTACLDACPTGAIVADGVVDSNLCISYWTIEHRGSIPAERRAGHGDWIFGCDVCQEVCPWNISFAAPPQGDPFERRDDLDGLDPETILAMDEATFRQRYSGTALMRAKWEGMRRNACVVLGNRANPASLGALGSALRDEDPVIRAHAAWAVARVSGDEARGLLERAENEESDPRVLQEIRSGLVA